ncbi:hypothetical protein AWC38_SpisGene20862 [Stylophora pistillata]|uniref:Uncharacterized protein n=1 Tax=Stylophora pistillata TaxID=50429 RepID=A0A2B4RF22_STYPI|nr:hypothetical protein AWC38_SpisGene20862 [Stylophora pistillata]
MGRHVLLAIDKVDFAEDTSDGKQNFQGTAIAIYQRSDPNDKILNLNIDISDRSRSIGELPESITSFLRLFRSPSGLYTYTVWDLFAENKLPLRARMQDFAWLLGRALTRAPTDSMQTAETQSNIPSIPGSENQPAKTTDIPARFGYNSLISDALPVMRVRRANVFKDSRPSFKTGRPGSCLLQDQRHVTRLQGPHEETSFLCQHQDGANDFGRGTSNWKASSSSMAQPVVKQPTKIWHTLRGSRYKAFVACCRCYNFGGYEWSFERAVWEYVICDKERAAPPKEVCAPVFTDLSINHSSATIRAVTGIVHSLVYDFAQSESYNLAKPVDQVQQSILPEDDVTLYRMSGAAFCQMIKLRKDTLSEKKGKRKVTSQSRIDMELELDILEKLKESDKNSLSQALKLLDEGNLTFVKKDFLNFVRDADLTIREYVNERKLNKHKNNFLEVVHFNVYSDE